MIVALLEYFLNGINANSCKTSLNIHICSLSNVPVCTQSKQL